MLPEARLARTDMIGHVESKSHGHLGVILSATVVRRATLSGLVPQVQVKPTDGRGAETADDEADRVRREGQSHATPHHLRFRSRFHHHQRPADHRNALQV